MNDSKKKYDVAFVPINNRLINLSKRLSEPLKNNGISSCILKTSLQGEDLSGWNEVNEIAIPLITLEQLCFKKKSNFFTYTYRSVRGIITLKKEWTPPFKLLVVFMDTYAEGEVLTNICKYKGISTLLFQEGFHVRNEKYSQSLYGLACSLRAELMSNYFTHNSDGMYADHVAVWSEYGMKGQLINLGRDMDTLHVVGNPLSLITKPSKLPSLPFHPVVLIIHQPMSPRYCSKEWENSLYVNLVVSLISCGYKVMFKPHPRIITNEALNKLKENINKSLEDEKLLEYVDRSIIAEDILPKCNVVITPISVTAYTALRIGIPTVFIKMPRIANELLASMHELNEISYLPHWRDVTNVIDKTLKDENLRHYWFKQGPLSARKLSGSSKDFDSKWSLCIKELLH
jgi:hypothetical protein